jgi:hypothetical protein
LKIIGLYKKIISQSFSEQFKTQNIVEFSNFEEIIFNQINGTKKSFILFQDILKSYFGNETGSEEEIISKYTFKFNNIQKSLHSISNIINSNINQNFNIINQITIVKQYLPSLRSDLMKINQILDNSKMIQTLIHHNLNYFYKLTSHQEQIHKLQNLFDINQFQIFHLFYFFKILFSKFSTNFIQPH